MAMISNIVSRAYSALYASGDPGSINSMAECSSKAKHQLPKNKRILRDSPSLISHFSHLMDSQL